MEVSNLKVISKEVLKAVDAASEEVMQIYKSDSYEIEGKIDGSPVTLADKRSHDVLSCLVRRRRRTRQHQIFILVN
jgi:3'-phosphoadenosine 5'-phosphosulfate (PAPS) 3'-phosphatase